MVYARVESVREAIKTHGALLHKRTRRGRVVESSVRATGEGTIAWQVIASDSVRLASRRSIAGAGKI